VAGGPRQRGGRAAAGSAVAAAGSAAVLFPAATRAPRMPSDREDDQRDPDQAEAREPGRRHRLVEDQDAAGQLQDRCHVCKMPRPTSGTRFADAANSNNGTAVATPASTMSVVCTAETRPELRFAGRVQIAQVRESRQREHGRLDEQPFGRRQRQPLLDQTVRAEAGRQQQRDVRQVP
jgi:hypothetical protein